MKKNDRFQFVVYRENYLTQKECLNLIKSLDTDELVDANLAGDYSGNIINKNITRQPAKMLIEVFNFIVVKLFILTI